jgi:transposase
VTTGFLSKPFFGLRARARRGEIFRKRSASGSPVYTRFWRWAQKGVWERVFKAFCDDPDFEYVRIDGTLVRVHQHGTGAKGGLKIRP